MKPSKLRHPLAILRQLCGLGQKVLADLVKCAPVTIQRHENGSLPLRDDRAQRISDETGIHPKWLLNGDTSAPPMSARWQPFTRATFKQTRMSRADLDRAKCFAAD